MVVQNPTLLAGSVTGLLIGTASYALTSSFANNITEQETLMWYARVPPSQTGIHLYLNSSSAAVLPFSDNKFYQLQLLTIAIVQNVRYEYSPTYGTANSYYYVSSSLSDFVSISNIYRNNTNISTQVSSGSREITISGSKDSYNKLKFTINGNTFTQQADVYVIMKPIININLQPLPSTI